MFNLFLKLSKLLLFKIDKFFRHIEYSQNNSLKKY
jgi:hypothetical protein